MKRRILIIATSIVAIGIVGIALWPKRVQLIGMETVDPAGLNVSILRVSSWENSIANREGKADFGRGMWRMPWQTKRMIVAVYDDEMVYWEGFVKPDCFSSVNIELTDGRPRNKTEKDPTTNP